ncbi:MAG: hypothetical protein ABL311_01365 [Nitratireductor rhodophyticola]|uniref:hypothetical protein n=1 Tax=Nitratireductor rhodophyticola TaxID=2854036 RepID=UPI0032D97380
MAGYWEFNKADPSSVRIGVTQRDQFNNDDVGLAEALVREVIQNSSDAGNGAGSVKVRFSLKTLNSIETAELAKYFNGLQPHLDACGIKRPDYEEGAIRVLVIEDYNTKGLTGSFEEPDKDNFDNFWRAVGESEKSGQKGGRWGLGKLVYSSSSRVRSFFGATVRAGENSPSVMGQAVLANHSIGNVYYPARGFWFEGRSGNGLNFQLPVNDPHAVEAFRTLFGVERSSQPGLSIIIPYLIDGITEDTILSGVVNNYYFPILAGKLEVEVGETLISASTFLDVAASVEKKGAHVPFPFVKEISDALGSTTAAGASGTIGDSRLLPDHLSPEQIEAMKAAFSAGNLVHLRVPVVLKPKGKAPQTGNIDLFIKALAEGEEPFSLFARGPITLPGERHFTGAVARGAMIAHDDIVAEFLGDAENPAHTAWNSNAEKLTSRWDSPRKTLSAIRQSLRDLYNMIADQKETQDEDALIDFFSLADKAQASKGKKKRVKKPKPEIPPREAAIRINPVNGGFEILAGPGAQQWSFPRRIRLRMAYDMIGADPFKRFSPFDFDLSKSKQIIFERTGGEIKAAKPNTLYFDVTGPDFYLKASGFDVVRDLIVDARAL